MKTVSIIIAIFCAYLSFSQTWFSIPVGPAEVLHAVPARQFIIDPYRNTIWMVADDKASIIENDGTMRNFGPVELGLSLGNPNIRFAFTPDHIFYKEYWYGVRKFDNYVPQMIYSSSNADFLQTDGDSLFFLDGDQGYIFKHLDGVSTENLQVTCAFTFVRKSGITYKKSSSNIFYYESMWVGNFLHQDPDYLNAPWNTFKFSRLSDTLYVAQDAGISYAYKENVLGNYTPANTTDMPSANVLDIEFDMNDSLWAVFGDSADEPFAIAMLSGNTWVNRFDSGNSPIFWHFLETIQFDTLNNLWVADWTKIHTLVTSTSPGWLSTLSLEQKQFSLSPNPNNGQFSIELNNDAPAEIYVYDLAGRSVHQQRTLNIETKLPSGTYIVEVIQDGVSIGKEKVVIQ